MIISAIFLWREIAGHCQNKSKIDHFKGGVDGFSYFSIILFSNQNHPGVIWYFDPGVNFLPLYFEPPNDKLTPPLISTKRGVHITIRVGLIYHR